MDNATLAQPTRLETGFDARCSTHGVIYAETHVDVAGEPAEVIVQGSFRRALDADGNPVGPVIPFCPLCKE